MKPSENEIALSMQHQINNYIISRDGCWLHRNKPNQDGYIRLRHISKNNYMAHRLSYALYVGDILEDMKVLHKCDMPACINPSHLFLGYQAQNIKDMYKKGRGRPKGKDQLLDEDIELIFSFRSEGLTQKEIAKYLGVSQGRIHQILRSAK